jgi:hypothetical protein
LDELVAKYLTHVAPDGDANATRNLIVGFKIEDETEMYSVDLLPFIQHCKSAPGLGVQLRTTRCDCKSCIDIISNINTLFAIRESPKLQAWLENRVVAIKLYYSYYIQFEMKDNDLDPWMAAWDDDESDKAWPPEVLDWEANTGLKLIEAMCFEPRYFKAEWRDYSRSWACGTCMNRIYEPPNH